MRFFQRHSVEDLPRTSVNRQRDLECLKSIYEALMAGYVHEDGDVTPYCDLQHAVDKCEVVAEAVKSLGCTIKHAWRQLRTVYPLLGKRKICLKKPRDSAPVHSCARQIRGFDRRDFSAYSTLLAHHETYRWPPEHMEAMAQFTYNQALLHSQVFLDAATLEPEKYLSNGTCVWETGRPQPSQARKLKARSVCFLLLFTVSITAFAIHGLCYSDYIWL